MPGVLIFFKKGEIWTQRKTGTEGREYKHTQGEAAHVTVVMHL